MLKFGEKDKLALEAKREEKEEARSCTPVKQWWIYLLTVKFMVLIHRNKLMPNHIIDPQLIIIYSMNPIFTKVYIMTPTYSNIILIYNL